MLKFPGIHIPSDLMIKVLRFEEIQDRLSRMGICLKENDVSQDSKLSRS